MKRLLVLFNALMVTFMLSPLVMIVLMSFTPTGGFTFPGWHWSLRWYRAAFAYPGFVDAFFLSLRLALISALIATVLSFAAVYAMRRFRFPGSDLLDALFMSPLLVPAVVFGIALLQFINRYGLYNTFVGLVLAHIVIIVPLCIRAITAALSDVPYQLEWAAMSLGASLPVVVWRVTLPLAGRGVLAGFLFAFILSFDEVTVTLFVTGPAYQTLPVRLYNYLTDQVDPTVAAVSSMLIATSLVLILVLNWIGGLRTLRH